MKAYTFLITLQGNKGVYRVLRIGGNYTLNDLHMQILKAFDFSADHLYMFSLNGRPYEAGGYYSPYADSGINAEMVMLDELKLVKLQKLLYLYDFGDDWMFDIVVKDIEVVSKATFPKVLEKKGELVQYPIWDDEEDWGEYMLEDPLSLHGDLFGMEDSDEDIAVEFDENMRSMEDVIAEWENDDLQVALNYLNVKVQGKKGGKRAKARAIAAELKQNPYKLTCLVPAGGVLALLELVKNQSIAMLDCLMNHDSMAMLNRLGLVDLEELPGGIIYYSAAAKK